MLTRVSPKERFQLLIEPAQLEALRTIEARVGAPVSVQIRRAIDDYLDNVQTALSKRELKELRGHK